MTTTTPNTGYRPEVDGLRALAILVVVLFHFGVPGFGGGFVGVDLFLVVSGYLITRNILSDIDRQRFTIAGFYVRRFRRIVPSFIATALVVLVLGFAIMPPRMLESTARSSTWSLFFASNFHFWKQIGYFDAEKYTKPLLHTWSLGVEEQFYLIWPLVLAVLLRFFSARWALLVIALGASLSFGVAALWVGSTTVQLPGVGMVFTEMADAFYLLPFRMWELALGGILAFPLIESLSQRLSATTRSVGSALGLVLIAWCASHYTTEMPFPGAPALGPCMAAVLVITMGGGTHVERMSRTTPVRYLGQLSYSLYLTHWPVIVFYRVGTFELPSWQMVFVLLGLSVVLADLLSRWVERPFRVGRFSTPHGMKRSGWLLASAGAALLVGAAAAIGNAHGFSWRMLPESSPGDVPHAPRRTSPTLGPIDQAYLFAGGTGELGWQASRKPGAGQHVFRAIVIGDSHAGHLDPVLDAIGVEKHITFDAWNFPGCPPVFGAYKIYWESGLTVESATQAACRRQIKQWQQHILSEHYDLVVLAARWTSLFEPTRYGDLKIEYAQLAAEGQPLGTRAAGRQICAHKLRATVDAITATGASVLLVGQIPEAGRMLDDCGELSRFAFSPTSAAQTIARRCRGIDRAQGMRRLKFTNGVLSDLARLPGVNALLLSDVLCPATAGRCITVHNGQVLYRNTDHINVRGAEFVRPAFSRVIERMLATRQP